MEHQAQQLTPLSSAVDTSVLQALNFAAPPKLARFSWVGQKEVAGLLSKLLLLPCQQPIEGTTKWLDAFGSPKRMLLVSQKGYGCSNKAAGTNSGPQNCFFKSCWIFVDQGQGFVKNRSPAPKLLAPSRSCCFTPNVAK